MSTAAGSRTSFGLVLLCFVLSGFAALLYQTVWTRQFAFVFGTSELAVATVLAAYLGGLSAGAAVAGRLAHRVRRPILVYGLLELGIAGAALAVPLAIAACQRLAVVWFGGGPEPPDAEGVGLPFFYLAASFAILLVPTGLMGATLPLLARHAVRSERELGGRIAALYAANTAGGVLGTVCAAFVLLPALGLGLTVGLGAATNLVVFGLAAVVARSAPEAPPAPAGGPAAPVSGARAGPAPLPRAALVLPLMLVSGSVSFVYEVLWTRLLGHVLGGSVHAFATMLAAFLTGIALGSALASRRAESAPRAARSFATTQLGIAAASLAAYLALQWLPGAAQALGAGPRGALWAGALLAAGILIPSTLFIGATFPLAVRMLARSEADASPATARVYAWNTVGAIVGAVGGGFFVIPALGYGDTVLLCVLTGLSLALVTALAFARSPARLVLSGALVLGVALGLRLGEPERLLRTSPLQLRPRDGELTYLAVGRSATVMLLDVGHGWQLRTNGLPESTILAAGRDRSADVLSRWMGGLASVARPELRSMLFVGFGGGRQLELLSERVERFDVIELEPEVIAANRRIADRRDPDPLADPRLRLHLNDARGALLLTERRWDAIVSQPSHPWTAGASHLYTREFFELVREHLTDDGVFVQWIGLRFVDEPLLRSLVATLGDVFPEVRVYWPPGRTTWLFLASDAPLPLEESLAALHGVDPGLAVALGLDGPEDLAIHAALDAEGTRRFAAGAAVSTDDRNLLQMHSRRALRAPVDAEALRDALAPLDPLVPPAGLDAPRLVRRLVESGQRERAGRVAATVADPAQRRIAEALVGGLGRPEPGLARLLAEHPDATLLRDTVLLRQLAPGVDATARRLTAAGDPGRAALVEAWEASRESDWLRVAAWEPALAGIEPGSPLFPVSQRLRIRWRIESNGPERTAEAVAIADRLLARARRPRDRILRAWAVAATGAAEPALGDLEAIERSFRDSGAQARLAELMRSALDELPRQGELGDRRRRLEQRLRAPRARGRGAT